MPTTSTSAIRQSTTNSGLTRASNVVTVTLSTGTQLNPQVGDTVVVSGVTPTSFNGTHTITERVSSTQYKFSQAGSDESSSVHGTSGGDYTSLSSWESAVQADLVTADKIEVAECYDDWPSGLSGKLAINGSTTSSTQYLKVTVASGHRHNGTPGSGFFHVNTSVATQTLRLNDPYCVIEWVDCFYNNTSGTDGRAYFDDDATGSTARNCIFRSAYTDGSTINYCAQASTTGALFYNCLIIGGYNGLRTSGTVYNSVITGAVVGVFRLPTALYRNCVSYGNSTTAWGSGSYDANCSNNATDNSTDDTPNAASGVTSVTSSDFVNAASNDFHLAAGSALIGAGVNLYSTFTTDIDGDTWPSAGAWDIGFDYYTGGAATSLPPDVSSRRFAHMMVR